MRPLGIGSRGRFLFIRNFMAISFDPQMAIFLIQNPIQLKIRISLIYSN